MIIHGPPKPDQSDHPSIAQLDRLEPKPKSSCQLQSNTCSLKKSRQRRIPYEIVDARKKERTEQHARRTEKAELAGGKASRKSKSAHAQHVSSCAQKKGARICCEMISCFRRRSMVVIAEGLVPLDSPPSLNLDVFVTLSDEAGTQLAKTRTIYESLAWLQLRIRPTTPPRHVAITNHVDVTTPSS